jgi:pyruvate kinase
VADGAATIMLAGETAAGRFPARAVQTLDAIIREAESGRTGETKTAADAVADHTQALCDAAVTLANRSDAQAIVAVTRGGNTARTLSALRPHAPIIAACDDEVTARRLSPYWGVTPVRTGIGEDVAMAGILIGQELVAQGKLPRDANIVLVSVNADLARTDANFLKIHRF